MAEGVIGNHEASADALIRVLGYWPQYTDALSAGNVLSLVDRLPTDSEKRLDLMQRLFDTNWKMEEESASELWYDLALTRVQRGELQLAREAAARIRWPNVMIRMQADRRFDGVVAPGPDAVTSALEELVARLESLARHNPRNLYTHNAWLESLLHAGRFTDVLEVSERLLAMIEASSPADPAFDDDDEQNFTLEIRSRALRRTERLAEAEAALVRASGMTEYGQSNISQKLGLARWYCARLRPDEAAAVVDGFSVMAEEYQVGERELILMRVALLTGKTEEADVHLRRILAITDGNEALANRALLRAGKVEAAAKLFKKRLSDERLRGAALFDAQTTREADPLPGDIGYRRAWNDLLGRDDIREAIESVGRVEAYALW